MNDKNPLDGLVERWRTVGYDALTDTEKLWLNIRTFIDSTQNGGLISYFFNPGANTFADCIASLEALGASEVLRHVSRLAACFGETVPVTVEARNDVIDSWPEQGVEEQLVEELDDILMPLMSDLDGLLARYLREHGIAT